MSGTFDDTHDPRGLLSALTDGEADAADCARACADWAAADAEVRSRWHAYHLIGDVLRSDDLAAAPAHDASLLQRLRLRLADEPALPLPLPTPSLVTTAARSRRAWVVPTALAASVMGLGTVWAVSQWGLLAPGAVPAGVVAGAPAPSAKLAAAAAPPPSAEPVAVGGKLMRDAQLDRYLRAHREYGAAAPGSLPGGTRSIETVSLQR